MSTSTMASSAASQPRSTEAPSMLKENLTPVKLRYVALPTPVTMPKENLITVTATETFRPPCRRCLEDASNGEVLHLINYDPFPEDCVSPYRGSGPVFVHAHQCKVFEGDKMPGGQAGRMMSVRAYNDSHMIIAAEVANGEDFNTVAGGMLADKKTAYVHAHNAKPGCFAFRADRA